MTLNVARDGDFYCPKYLRILFPGADFRMSCERMFKWVGKVLDSDRPPDLSRWGKLTWTAEQRRNFSRWHERYLIREKGMGPITARFVARCFLDQYGFRVAPGVRMIHPTPRERRRGHGNDEEKIGAREVAGSVPT